MGSVANIRAIAAKELRSYFASPVAWVMMGIFAFIFAWFYVNYVYYFISQSTQAGMLRLEEALLGSVPGRSSV